MKRLLSLLLLLSILLSLLTACNTTPGDTSSGGSDAEAVQIPQRFFLADGREVYTRLYSMLLSGEDPSRDAANLRELMKGVQPYAPAIGGASYDGEIHTTGDYVVETDDQLKAALQKAKSGEVIFVPSGVTIDISDLAATESYKIALKKGVILASDRGINEGGVIRISHPMGIMITCEEGAVITGINLCGVVTAFEENAAIRKDTGIRILGKDVRITNCEFASFSEEAIRVSSNGTGIVEHCYFHHCGTAVSDSKKALTVTKSAFFANEKNIVSENEELPLGEENGVLTAVEPQPLLAERVQPDITMSVFPADGYGVYTLLEKVEKGDTEALREAIALHSGTDKYYFYKDQFTIERDGKIYGITPDGSPLGGGAGYGEIVTSGDFTAETAEELQEVLWEASPGQTVFIPSHVQMDLTEFRITVPAGVTLASDRGAVREDGSISPGAMLFTTTRQREAIMLKENARFTGITLAGPDTERHMTHLERGLNAAGNKYTDYYYKLPLTRGVSIIGNGAEVDNCEIAGFSEAGIYIGGYIDVTVHHNWIHHNQRNGFGYGVAIYEETYAEIYRNLFNFDRHAIAAGGSANSGYTAHDNAHLGTAIYHIFDAHGGGDRGDGTQIACERVDMFNNVFLSDKIPYKKRGTPEEYSRFTRNIVIYPEMRYPYRQLYGENFICEDNIWGLSEELPVYDFEGGKTYVLKTGGDLRLYENMESIDAKTHKLRYAYFLVFTPTETGYYISEYGNNLDDGSINGEIEIVKIPKDGFVLVFTSDSYKPYSLYTAIAGRHEVIYNTSLGLDGDYIATREGDTVTVIQSVE